MLKNVRDSTPVLSQSPGPVSGRGPDITVIKGNTTRSEVAAPPAPTFAAQPILAPMLNTTEIKLRDPGTRSPLPHHCVRPRRSIFSARIEDCDIHADNELECIRPGRRPRGELNVLSAPLRSGPRPIVKAQPAVQTPPMPSDSSYG